MTQPNKKWTQPFIICLFIWHCITISATGMVFIEQFYKDQPKWTQWREVDKICILGCSCVNCKLLSQYLFHTGNSIGHKATHGVVNFRSKRSYILGKNDIPFQKKTCLVKYLCRGTSTEKGSNLHYRSNAYVSAHILR